MKPIFSTAVILAPHGAWRAWWVCILGFVAFAIATTLWRSQLQHSEQSLLVAKQKLGQARNQVQSQAPAISHEFLVELPRAVRSQLVVENFQHTAREAGVTVASLSLRETPAKPDRLGRLELTVMGQGTYPALKQVLAEWLARFPSATVRSQQWRRVESAGTSSTGSTTVEANWVLSIWTRPSGIEAGAKLVSSEAPSAASAPLSTPAP